MTSRPLLGAAFSFGCDVAGIESGGDIASEITRLRRQLEELLATASDADRGSVYAIAAEMKKSTRQGDYLLQLQQNLIRRIDLLRRDGNKD